MMLANGMCLSCRQFRGIAILEMRKKDLSFLRSFLFLDPAPLNLRIVRN